MNSKPKLQIILCSTQVLREFLRLKGEEQGRGAGTESQISDLRFQKGTAVADEPRMARTRGRSGHTDSEPRNTLNTRNA
jgi:hypothetical protein